MRQIHQYTFEATVKGEKTELTGKGTNSFEGNRDALIKTMRSTGSKYAEIEIGNVIKETPTDEWV